MLGEAYSDALVLAYDGDYEAPFNAPEGDYEEMVMTFSTKLNRFVIDKDRLPRRVMKFFFIKRKSKL